MEPTKPPPALMEFTVKRSQWYRGMGPINSRLLAKDGDNKGQMCCLGFLAKACGMADEDIAGVPDPGTCPESVLHLWPKGILTGRMFAMGRDHTSVTQDIVTENDRLFAEDTKEARLTELFKKIGITVRFED